MAKRDASEPTSRAARSRTLHHLSGVECFEAVWQNHRTRPHAHPEYQLTWTAAGVGRMRYRAGSARIPSGCMALFHPAEPHQIENADREPWSVRSLHLPEALLAHSGVPLLQPAPFRASAELVHAFEALWQAAHSPDVPLDEELSALGACLCALPGLDPVPDAASQIVRRALAHLAAVLDRTVPVSELAEVAACSPARLRRMFVAATGLPPHAWHVQRRIAYAKHALSRGEGIAELALATGFADQAHFTRHFTALVGVSPARWVGSARPDRAVALVRNTATGRSRRRPT